MKFAILFCAALLGGMTVRAQQPSATAPAPWTLEECIEYARRHNIDLQQQALQVEQSAIELNTTRNSRLPDLGASLGGNLSFGRSLVADNTYADNNQLSGSLGVSASLPLFRGGSINHQIAAGKLGLQAAVQELERGREEVALNVMSLYLEVLFQKELVTVAEEQLALSSRQVERSREEVARGKSAESVLYENLALQARDELSLTQSRNDLALALLTLSQAINRPDAEGFDIEAPAYDSTALAAMGPLRNPNEVTDYALDNRPRILGERLRLEQARRSVRTARAAYYPQIALSGGYGTNVYRSYAAGAINSGFWNQFRHNSSEWVGLSVNIPIFNRLATRNSVRTARLNVAARELSLTAAEQALRKEIETAYYTADAARLKYRSAEKALESARVAFRYEAEKFAAGRSTTFDYNDAKTRMQRAESELIQAKYEFIFRTKILDFYAGEPLSI